jgi:hypothetical protein
MQYRPLPRPHRVQADYTQWSIEELWQLAAQMRVAGARGMSRRELIDLFAVPPKSAAELQLTARRQS